MKFLSICFIEDKIEALVQFNLIFFILHPAVHILPDIPVTQGLSVAPMSVGYSVHKPVNMPFAKNVFNILPKHTFSCSPCSIVYKMN